MEKFKRVWRQEGESIESYSKRLEEAYDEMLQTEEAQNDLNKLKHRIYRTHKELKDVDKKIIELADVKGQGWDCLICCNNDAMTEVNICRPKYGDNVITFRVCNECLAKMQKDIGTHQ